MKGPIIDGKQTQLVVLRVLERDDAGRPSRCLIGYDDTTLSLNDPYLPNEFLTAFVQENSVKPEKAGHA